MTRKVTLHLDEFGQQSLERLVDGGDASPASALRTAALYYLGERDDNRAAWRAPRFQRKQRSSSGLRVAFDDDTWTALEAEARRQNVEPPALAVHALLYFLSDFDSGRVADVLGERLQHRD
jgi:Arc/MetJ-type ribon-helix-helix transcriptional regulator